MRATLVALTALACLTGCAAENAGPAGRPLLGKGDQVIPTQVSHVQAEVQPLAEAPNNGLLLPAVSPDGRWAACLDWRGSRPAALDALFTGRGLGAMALVLRELAPGGRSVTVSEGGAAWPAWSPDSQTLAFVDRSGERCDVCTYEVSTGQLSRHSLTVSMAAMLAVAPGGRMVAFVASDEHGNAARLHVADLATGRVDAAPDLEGKPSRWPQWTPDGRVLFLLTDGSEVWLAQWGPGRFPPEAICPTRLPASPAAQFQALAGLGRPLSPDGRRFAVYDAGLDAIILLELPEGARTELPGGTRSGCWLNGRQFVAATDQEMRLYGQGNSALLMRGQWLPRGADENNRLIACTRGSHSRALGMARIVVTGE